MGNGCFGKIFPKTWKDFRRLMPAKRTVLITANEAASVMDVPLRQVHRLIDASLLDGALKEAACRLAPPRSVAAGCLGVL
jgi:hypothetical protein